MRTNYPAHQILVDIWRRMQTMNLFIIYFSLSPVMSCLRSPIYFQTLLIYELVGPPEKLAYHNKFWWFLASFRPFFIAFVVYMHCGAVTENFVLLCLRSWIPIKLVEICRGGIIVPHIRKMCIYGCDWNLLKCPFTRSLTIFQMEN
jgi:hypothetical protein